MADDQLAELFANGTAPERDAVFAERIDARIATERRVARLLVLSIRALVIPTLGATAFVTVRVLEPTLQQITESSLEFMDVPVSHILAVIGIGLAVRLWLFARLRLS